MRAPCVLRACSVRAPCVLRACSVRAPCVLRACSVRAPCVDACGHVFARGLISSACSCVLCAHVCVSTVQACGPTNPGVQYIFDPQALSSIVSAVSRVKTHWCTVPHMPVCCTTLNKSNQPTNPCHLCWFQGSCTFYLK